MKTCAQFVFTVVMGCMAASVSAAICSVDPLSGVDEPGASAYKTLTYALSQHGGDTTYNLAAGTYSADSGETFPITLSGLANVAIVGPDGQKAVFDAAGANTRVFVVESACDTIAFSNLMVTGSAVAYDTTKTGQTTGAVSLKDSTNISFFRCGIVGNTSTKVGGSNTDIYGAGLSIFTCNGVSFDQCLIKDNMMTDNGWGRIYGAGAGLYYAQNVSFVNSEFIGNGCNGSGAIAGAVLYSMAGMFNVAYVITFENCLFRNNSAASTGTEMQQGACVALQYKSGGGNPTANFIRCTFLENSGEPIHNSNSKSTATECVYVGNSMPDGGNRATTYTDCIWESFDDVYGYHPLSGDDPARTPAETWYVSPTGDDANNGHDADHPLRTLGKAFSLVKNNATVYVADGVYNVAGGETFPLKLSKVLNLKVVGGAGTPVIDAGRTDRALEIFGCHGLCITNIAVTGGQNKLGGLNYGGGIRLRACRGVFQSCAITNNLVATSWSQSDTYAGGLFVRGNSSSVTLDGCLVADNDIGSTGGRQAYGGGLATEYAGMLAISNCIIRNNGAVSANMKKGGGVFIKAPSKFDIFNTLFVGNRSTGDGAAVYSDVAGTMANCTVADNLVSVPLVGSIKLLNSICTGNAAAPAAAVALDHTMTTDPGFVGDSYLVETGSAAIDAGSVTAESLGLGEPMTIRADGIYDTDLVDLGYHRVSTGPVVAITDLYVSPTGSDANDGLDADHPLRSITKALSLVQNNTTVHLSAGAYDVEHGEVFPLTLEKPGMKLVCEDGQAFVDATGGEGSALAVQAAQNFTLRNIVFANAWHLGMNGGGLDIRNSSGCIDGCVVSNCVVSMNSPTETTSAGGGLYFLNAVVAMTNCVIVRNGTDITTSNNPRSHGGGLYVEGASSVELVRCSLVSNYLSNAGFGTWGAAAGLPLNGGNASLKLRSCLVVGNRRKDGSSVKSALSAPYGTLVVENCTIADNVADKGAISNLGEGFSNKATISVVNSILYGNGAETNGIMTVEHSLINVDPRFRKPAKGDYRLRGSSPCIDTGLNADWMKSAVDLKGDPRIRCGVVDMGCYECPAGGLILLVR